MRVLWAVKIVLPKFDKCGYDEVTPEAYLLRNGWVKVETGGMTFWKVSAESKTLMFPAEAVRKQYEMNGAIHEVLKS